jgi:hypothetical protein
VGRKISGSENQGMKNIHKIIPYSLNLKGKSYKNKGQTTPTDKSSDGNIHKIKPYHINLKDKSSKNKGQTQWAGKSGDGNIHKI